MANEFKVKNGLIVVGNTAISGAATVGGNSVIHTGNIGSYAVTSLSDTLDSVTSRGSSTSNTISIGGISVTDNFIFTLNRTVNTVSVSPKIRWTGSNVGTVELYAEQNALIISPGISTTGIGTTNLNFGSTTGSANSPIITGGNGFRGGIFFLGGGGNAGVSGLGFVYGDYQEGMRLNTTGNLLVGTTTDSGYKLDVNGSARLGNTDYYATLTTGGADGGVFRVGGPYYGYSELKSYALSLNGGHSIVGSGGTTQFIINSNVSPTAAQSNAGIQFIADNGGSDSGNTWSAYPTALAFNFLKKQLNGSYTSVLAINGATNNVGIGTTSPAYKLDVVGGIKSTYLTTSVVHGEGNTLLLLSGLNGANPGVNEARLHLGYNQNDPVVRLNSNGVSVNTGTWYYLTQTWFAAGITSNHNIPLAIDGMTNGVASGTAGDIIKFTQRNGQFASFYDAGAGLSEFRIWQQANSSNYIYLKPGQTSYFSSGNLVVGGTTDAGYKLDVNGSARIASSSSDYKLRIQTTGVGNGNGLLLTQLGYTMLDITSDVFIKPYPGNSNKTHFWNWNGAGGSHNVLTLKNSEFLETGGAYSVPLVQFPDNQVPIVLGNTATANLRSYLTVGGYFKTISGLAAGQQITTSLAAAANNDVLVGLDINPTFNNGAFTGVENYAIRTAGKILSIYDSPYDSTATNSNFVLQHSNGNQTGIGITSDGAMRVKAPGSSPFVIMSGSVQTWFNRYNHSSIQAFNGDFGIYGGADVQKFRIFNSTGNVVIQNGGTFTDAGYRLDVNGDTRVQGTLTLTGNIQSTNGGNSKIDFLTQIGANTNDLTISSQDQMQINVGYGNLSINTGLSLQGSISTGARGRYLVLGGGEDYILVSDNYGGGGYHMKLSTWGPSHIQFGPGSGIGEANFVPKFTMTPDTRFGVGTMSPSTAVDVVGVITATGGNSTDWNTAFSWGNHASAGYLTSGSLSGYATQSYVTSAISALVDAAPAALDTLNELAAALGDDANFSTTITNSIAGKLPLTGGTLTGALNGTSASFSSNVTLGNNADLVFQDLSGTFPTTGKGFDWTLNNDGARIYAYQPNSDSIDFVFQLRDNATLNDRFVFWVDEWQGPAYDKYPLIISGGTQFDLKDSALYTNSVLRLSNSGVLQNVTGNISMFTNDAGYLTSYTETDTLNSVTGRGATTTNAITTGTHTIYGSNATGVESVLLQFTASGDTLGSIRTYNAGGYNQHTRFYTSNVTGTTETLAFMYDHNGNVGIGTSSPVTNLHVAGSARVAATGSSRLDLDADVKITGQYYANNQTEYTYLNMYNGANASINIGTKHQLSYISFESGNGAYTERMRITNTGNILIGTTTDSGYMLDVNGTARIRGNVDITTSGGTNVLLAYSSYVQAWQSFYVSQGGGAHNFAVSNASSGGNAYFNNVNVGIGTTTPGTKLDVNGVITATGGNSSQWNTAYSWGNHATAGYLTSVSDVWVNTTGDTMTGSLTFANNADDVRINKNNNWLNLYDPWNNIHLRNGNSGYGVYIDSTVHYWRPHDGSVFWMTLNGGNLGIGTTSPTQKLEVAGYGLFQSGVVGSSGLTFYGDNSSATGMVLTTAGNVGIGTTSPDTPLVVQGGSAGTGGWNRTATLSATYPGLIFNSNGTKWGGMAYDYSAAMRFWVNANNNDIFAGTLAMSILNNGNVGIGTSSPTERLEVTGSIRLSDGNADGPQLKLASSGYSDWNIDNYNGSLRAYYGGTEYTRLTSSGYFGIGTTSPSEKLHVSGSAIFDGGAGNSSTDSVVYITKSNNNDWGLYVNASGLDYGMYARVSPSAGYAIGVNNGTDWTTRITGNAIIYLGEKNAIEGNYDTWLRLNNSNHYTSGVYTPGVMRADGGFNVSGSTVWHAGNDGSGSGLDADLFDGIDSSRFVYGNSGTRRGTNLISNWNQTDCPDVAFLSAENGGTNAPSSDYTYGMQYSFHRSGSAYRTQFVTSLYSDLDIWVRNSRDSDVWTSWKRLWHSSDFSSTNISNWNTAYSWGNHAGLYDNYGSWNLKTNGTQRTTVQSGGTLDIVAGTNVSVSYGAGGVVTINSTDTNTTYTAGTGLTLSGTQFSVTSGTYAAASHTHSATDITSGTLASARLSGTYSIDISGKSAASDTMLREDNRNISPSELSAGYMKFGFTSWTNDNNGPYADFLHLRSYTDASGGSDNLVMFKKSGIGMRIWQQAWGSGTAYSTYEDVWTTGSFTSTNVSNWNTAYGWGNHASAGYLTSSSLTGYATQTYVNNAVSALVDSAPGTLDTLNELAAALGDDPNFATTVTNNIATKLPLAGGTLTGDLTLTYAYPRINLYDTNNDSDYSIINNDGNFSIYDITNNSHRFSIAANGNATLVGSLTVSGGNSSNWNTAYGWGNHAVAGYATTTQLADYLPLTGGTIAGVLTVSGNLTVNGTITENSSIKIKENVEDLNGSLEKVVNLRPVSYNKIGQTEKELGLIAEEVQTVYPEFVQFDENGEPVGVNYSRLTVALIGAVQELTKQVEELKNKING